MSETAKYTNIHIYDTPGANCFPVPPNQKKESSPEESDQSYKTITAVSQELNRQLNEAVNSGNVVRVELDLPKQDPYAVRQLESHIPLFKVNLGSEWLQENDPENIFQPGPCDTYVEKGNHLTLYVRIDEPKEDKNENMKTLLTFLGAKEVKEVPARYQPALEETRNLQGALEDLDIKPLEPRDYDQLAVTDNRSTIQRTV
ncbi:MAG: hypothetical protein H6908_02415 [Hyphomicrobiales bacterium]|nr:hypothetical protein [Hyphomicrobiales bacterium]